MFASFLCALVIPFLTVALEGPFTVLPAKLAPSGYHRWAHYNWIWLHNGLGNQSNVEALVKGYKDNHIPVGAVNIDSTWATQFNNFEVNTAKFPDFAGLVKSLHDQSLRVILWATSMVNVENPDYDMCVSKNYLVRDVRGKVYPLHWWHGDGGLLDYSNPEAVAWWHSKMDLVLDVGVDGFKCDGTDPYIDEYILTGGALGYDNHTYTYREYADYYYRDFFYYTRAKRGDAGLIMSRPTDCLVDPVTKVCTNFSPKDVMYSGWVGDDDATFNGMAGCARKVIYSAWNGYANFGCDIGGYRGNSELNKYLFVRWAQFGAFLPLMENGGGGEHKPWMYDSETVDIYRRFAETHHRLAPYLLTNGATAVESGVSAILPVAERPADISPYASPFPSTYSYRLGPSILVHPVMHDLAPHDKSNIAVVDAQFPLSGSQWLDFWRPFDASLVRQGGSRALLEVPLTSFAAYVRRGDCLPLQRSAVDDAVEFTWYGPRVGESQKADMREPESDGTGITASMTFAQTSEGASLTASLSAHTGPGSFTVIGVSEPSEITINAGPLTQGCRQSYTKLTSTLSVHCLSLEVGVKIVAKGLSGTL